jgi:hypothetical protein
MVKYFRASKRICALPGAIIANLLINNLKF